MTLQGSESDRSPLRLAIVGCGAIAEFGHLPGAAAAQGVHVTALVEKNIERAQTLASKHDVPFVTGDYTQLADHAEAAIIALPPALHAPVAIDLLNRGIHVLVEKPMAMTPLECDQMNEAASANNRVLAIGLVRRFRWAYRYVKQVIETGMLGAIKSFDVREGGVFDWPVATPFFLTKKGAGGGVLADAGTHALDALLWWFGDVESFNYYDDDFGGVEADCELQLVMKNGVRGNVELSRTRQMPNTTSIHGENGSLTLSAFNNDITIKFDGNANDKTFTLTGNLDQSNESGDQPTPENIMADQLSDFADAIRGNRPPTVTGQEGRRSVALVEACYAHRKPLIHPWTFEDIPLADGATDQHDPRSELSQRPMPANAVGGEV